jgi:hypothetical protein
VLSCRVNVAIYSRPALCTLSERRPAVRSLGVGGLSWSNRTPLNPFPLNSLRTLVVTTGGGISPSSLPACRAVAMAQAGLCFHIDANCFFRNPFILIFMQIGGGWGYSISISQRNMPGFPTQIVGIPIRRGKARRYTSLRPCLFLFRGIRFPGLHCPAYLSPLRRPQTHPGGFHHGYSQHSD